jgi:ribose transport system permease protein
MIKTPQIPVRPIWQQVFASSNTGLLLAYLAIVVVFSIASPFFLSRPNIINVAQTLAIIGIVAAGEALVILHGGYDLSVGATAALSGVVIGILWNNNVLPIWPATLAGITAGAVVGLLNGLIVTKLRINPIITTLGTLSLARGLAFVLTGGQTNQLNDEMFMFIGRGAVGGVPVSLILMGTIYIIIYFMLRYSDFGRSIYAVGGSPDAARLAGIDVERVRIRVYLLAGILAATGGVVLAAQLGASFPKAASGLELTVIAAVILGGCTLGGGKGSITGTLLGVLILRTVDNGLVIAGISSYYQDVARGAVLLIAVGFDQVRNRWQGLRSRVRVAG